MRIIHAADYGGPYAGSFVPMLRAVAAEGRRRGHELVAVFTPVARGRPWLVDLERDGIPVVLAGGHGRAANRAALRRALTDGPGVVHTHFTGFDLAAVAETRGRTDTAVVWHLHSNLSASAVVRAVNLVKFGLIGRRVDRLVAVAPHIAAAARSRGAPAARVMAMSNGIDTERLPVRDPERAAAARAALSLPTDVPVVLHFGHDWHRKGGDILLEAAGRLRAAGHPARIVTVAGEEARAAIGAAGLEDRVTVLAAQQDVSLLYTMADAFVSCSRGEGMPYAVLEAATTGTGLVLSDIPGQTEFAGALPGARVVALDGAAVAQAMIEVMDRPAVVAAAEGHAARAWVQEHGDVRGFARALTDLYEELVPSRR